MLKTLMNRLFGCAAPISAAPIVAALDQTTTIMRRQSLEATVIRACVGCGGKMLSEKGEPFDVCPGCGTPRRSPEHLGEIWHRDFTG